MGATGKVVVSPSAMLTGFEKVLLGVLVLVLMVGMGATLTLDHFKGVVRRPKGLVIGLLSQFGWMPLVAYGLAVGLQLPAEMAIGLVIIGSTPGGTTSNLFTYFARADLALSISMTTVSTLVAVLVMPAVLYLYASAFTSSELAIPYGQIAQTLAVVLVPVAIGMAIRHRSERAARVTEKVGSYAGIAVLLLLVVSGLVNNGELLGLATAEVFAAAIGLGLCGMGLGLLAARALGLGVAQRRAVALETGIQNSPLAFAIIITSFPDALHGQLLFVPLLYALCILVSSTLVTAGFRASTPPDAEGARATVGR